MMIFSRLIIFLAAAALIYSIVTDDRLLFLSSFAALALGVIVLAIFRIVSSTARCSLCASAVLLSSRAQRNKHAWPLFGSYRFRVARDIAFTGIYRCPHCGERTLCIPKDKFRQH